MSKSEEFFDRRAYHAGQRIFAQGDPGDCAYYIEKGVVEVITEDKRGNRVIVAELGPESVFGEMSLVNDQPRSATVRAKEPTTVRVIKKADFIRRIAKADKVTHTLINLLIARISETNARMLAQASMIAEFEDHTRAAMHKIKMASGEDVANIARGELELLLDRLTLLMEKMQG